MTVIDFIMGCVSLGVSPAVGEAGQLLQSPLLLRSCYQWTVGHCSSPTFFQAACREMLDKAVMKTKGSIWISEITLWVGAAQLYFSMDFVMNPIKVRLLRKTV